MTYIISEEDLRDLRDPILLGEALERLRKERNENGVPPITLSELYDLNVERLNRVEKYSSNLGPLEKYGDPRLLPPTQ